jgi:hypothetical protein
VRLEKPVVPLNRVRRLPETTASEIRFGVLRSLAKTARDFGCRLPSRYRSDSRLQIASTGAGEGIRTPDPLITNQMLYRLSYASKHWGKTRSRANLSLGSHPDVRDNYIKYHSGKLGCNIDMLRLAQSGFNHRDRQ